MHVKGFISLRSASHPDVVQLVLKLQASISLLQAGPVLVSGRVSSLTLHDDLEEDHLLWEATEAVAKADFIVSLYGGLHPGATRRQRSKISKQQRLGRVPRMWNTTRGTHTWTPSERCDSKTSWMPCGEVMVKSTSMPAPAITWMCTNKDEPTMSNGGCFPTAGTLTPGNKDLFSGGRLVSTAGTRA